MSKHGFIFGLLFYDLIIALVAGALGFTTNVDVLAGSSGQVLDALGFFLNIMFFNVAEIPILVALIFFHTPNLVGLFILLEMAITAVGSVVKGFFGI